MRLTLKNPKTLLVMLYVVAQIGILLWYVLIPARQPAGDAAFTNATEKVYVAVEEEGKIAVLNSANNVVRYIDLSKNAGGMVRRFSPHNVQVAPDGKSVWVTGNVAGGHAHGFNPAGLLKQLASATGLVRDALADADHDHAAPADGSMQDAKDEVIVLDPETDRIIKRIPLGSGLHLAHVVLTPDSGYALVTAQQKDLVFTINTRTFDVEKQLGTGSKTAPHGLRVSVDGAKAYIAMSTGKALGILDIPTGQLSLVPLKGQAVQAGVTPDGKRAVVSLYDTKSLAVYDIATKIVTYIDLPSEAKGPVQMYPTPDSRYIYLADQGYYFDQPASNKVYKIELSSSKVVATITAGQAPHGAVVSKDGKRAYVTNLLSGDLSVIDAARDTEIDRIAIGGQPNGVSIWSRSAGGTP